MKRTHNNSHADYNATYVYNDGAAQGWYHAAAIHIHNGVWCMVNISCSSSNAFPTPTPSPSRTPSPSSMSTPAGGYALHFNGQDDAVVDSRDLIGPRDGDAYGDSGRHGLSYTVELWVDPAAHQNASAAILSTYDTNSATTGVNNHVAMGYALQQDGTRANAYHWMVAAGDIGVTPDFYLEPDRWQHVAIVYDDRTLHVAVYVDGKRVVNAGNTNMVPGINPAGQPLRLGNSQCCSDDPATMRDHHWIGSIDDLRISNDAIYRGLSFSPLRHAFAPHSILSRSPDPVTVALFSFDEGDGSAFASDTIYETGFTTKWQDGHGVNAVASYGPNSGYIECGHGVRADFSGACPLSEQVWVPSPLPPAPIDPSLIPVSAPLQLGWDGKVGTDGSSRQDNNTGWQMLAQVSADRGLVLRDVSLRRYMAQDMSLPFVTVTTKDTGPKGYSFRLTPRSAKSDQSDLVNFRVLLNGGYTFNIIATYKARIPIGGHYADTVYITQRYEFDPTVNEKQDPQDACEASQDPLIGRILFPGLTCAFFRPTVHYDFVPVHGDKLVGVQTTQRLVFLPDKNSIRGSTLIHDCAEGEKGTRTAPCEFPVFRDDRVALNCGLGAIGCLRALKCLPLWDPTCAPIDDMPNPTVYPCDETMHHLSVPCRAGPGIQKLNGEDPLTRGFIRQVIVNGKQFNDPQTGHSWDNLHLTSSAVGKVEPPIPVPPGCAECVHFHWRWDAYFTSPRFGNGNPLIRAGSNQDVSIAVTPARPCSVPNATNSGCHDEDVRDVAAIARLANGTSLNTSTGQVLWYIGTGHRSEDVFFAHGGFFDPEKQSIPCENDRTCPVVHWYDVGNGEIIQKGTLFEFAALQTRAPDDSRPLALHVLFTYQTTDGKWHPACGASAQRSAATIFTFRCFWSVPTNRPNGPLRVSFDVELPNGYALYAPAGKLVVIVHGASQKPPS